ncbi:MAG TPA: hypothetical protein VGF30_13820 [Bacteroidia bacterium]
MTVLKVSYPVSVVAVFVWIGFVCAISFMEAWLKFRAPGINLPLGLGIGRIVFNALNKVEWVLAIAIILNFLFAKQRVMELEHLFLLAPLIILIIQTVYALPALDARARLHIEGSFVPPSNLHFYYVAMEAIKVTGLIVFGIKLFK